MDTITNHIDALHMLFSAVTSNVVLDNDKIKTIAENLGTTFNDILKVTTNSIIKLLPSSLTIYAFFILCIIIIISVFVLLTCSKFDFTFASNRYKCNHSFIHIPRLTNVDNKSEGVTANSDQINLSPPVNNINTTSLQEH